MNADEQKPAVRSWPTGTVDLQEKIRQRAEEIYVRNGRIPGRDLQNWAQAEKEIREEAVASQPRRKAVVVHVEGVQYVGEYVPEESEGYTPGEFTKGEPVPVRFDGEKMFVKRLNGKELETTVVSKVGLGLR